MKLYLGKDVDLKAVKAVLNYHKEVGEFLSIRELFDIMRDNETEYITGWLGEDVDKGYSPETLTYVKVYKEDDDGIDWWVIEFPPEQDKEVKESIGSIFDFTKGGNDNV